MELHFKETTWYSIIIPEELEEEARELVKSGKIQTGDDAFTYLNKKGVDLDYESMDNTSKAMFPIENDGQATLHIMEDIKDTPGMKSTLDNSLEDYPGDIKFTRFSYDDKSTYPKKYGKYLVAESDGRRTIMTWNLSAWSNTGWNVLWYTNIW